MTFPQTIHHTLVLDGRDATLTLEQRVRGGPVRAILSSPSCFMDGEEPGIYTLVPQLDPPANSRIHYCGTCDQPVPSDVEADAPCTLCGARPEDCVLRPDVTRKDPEA